MSRFRAEAHSAVSRMCWRGILPSNSAGSTFRQRVLTDGPASGWLKKAVSRRDREAPARRLGVQCLRIGQPAEMQTPPIATRKLRA